MSTKDKTVALEHVACKTCMKEIPLSEAIIPEATDYVAHFCSVECYDRWKKQPGNPYIQDDIPTVAMPL